MHYSGSTWSQANVGKHWECFNTSKTEKKKKTIYRIPGLGSEDILIYLIFFEVFKCKLNNFLIIQERFYQAISRSVYFTTLGDLVQPQP